MIGRIDIESGLATLDGIPVSELRTLRAALELAWLHHHAEDTRLSELASDQRRMASKTHARRAHERAAGELEHEASLHRASAIESDDLLRVVRALLRTYAAA